MKFDLYYNLETVHVVNRRNLLLLIVCNPPFDRLPPPSLPLCPPSSWSFPVSIRIAVRLNCEHYPPLIAVGFGGI